jgi:hypothetical protein
MMTLNFLKNEKMGYLKKIAVNPFNEAEGVDE